MLVKCINNDGDSRLTVGEFYVVNCKIRYENSMTLVGLGGKYMVNRFIDKDNNKINKDFCFINKRYNPPINLKQYGYVMPIPNRLKSLERKVYKIDSIKTERKRDNERYINGKLYSVFYKRIKIEGFYGWFNAKNFLFFTKEEGEQLLREEKIEQITKKLNNE